MRPSESRSQKFDSDARIALRAIGNSQPRDIVVTESFTRTPQAGTNNANEIVGGKASSAEAFGKRCKIARSERGFEFGERPERQHEFALLAADLRFYFTAMTVCHQAASNISSPADSSEIS